MWSNDHRLRSGLIGRETYRFISKEKRLNMEKMQDKEFLEFVVKSLVDNPDAVEVDRNVDEMGVLLSLKVDPQDMGTIIGRSGNTAKAIRTLLRVVGMKHNARVNLKIEEPEGGASRPSSTENSESASNSMNVDDALEDLKA